MPDESELEAGKALDDLAARCKPYDLRLAEDVILAYEKSDKSALSLRRSALTLALAMAVIRARADG